MSKGHFINGKWTRGVGAEMISTDPASGESIWQGRSSTPPEIDSAVAAARQAFASWSALSIEQRADYLQKFGELAKKQRAEFAETICLSTGKPRWEAGTEVDTAINKVTATLQAHAQRRQLVEQAIAGAKASTHYNPHGVVAVLGPFNFPAHLPNGHIMPALLAGNTVVFKPSELAPLVAERMVQLWQEAGLPDGVLNLVHGARETGKWLVEHAGIDGVFFTGSFEAGRAINRSLADHPGKIVALEMGGNNPLVVHKVSDLDAAAYWTIQSAYLTAGQRCSCARRLIVVDDGDALLFIARLSTMIQRIIAGRYTDNPEPFMGPVITDAAADKLMAVQDELLKRGAVAAVEMKCLGPRPAMLSPGLIDVTLVKDRRDEEYFGPLFQIIRVKDFDHAIAEANNTRFGLTAGLFSDDRQNWEIFRSRIRAGLVNWNRPLTGASAQLPFGGIGCSGNNRPSAYFAADYCSYPVASMQAEILTPPQTVAPGIRPPASA